MKVTENVGPTRTTTLNDIPVGEVFRGDILSKVTGRYYSGIFYKAYSSGTLKDTRSETKVSGEVVVVRLDRTDLSNTPGEYCNLITKCMPVHNYEPLEVELVIKGRK